MIQGLASAFNVRWAVKWLGPPIAACCVLAIGALLVAPLGGGPNDVELRENGVLIGHDVPAEAAAKASQRLGFRVLIPSDPPPGMHLEYVDSVLPLDGALRPYSEIGYMASGQDADLSTLRISQVAGVRDFPIEKSVSVPVNLDNVEVWRPPSPFQDGDGKWNFQFIVRMNGQQLVLWWVQNEEPGVDEVRQLLHSMK